MSIIFIFFITLAWADTFVYVDSKGSGALVDFQHNPPALHYIHQYIQEQCGLTLYAGKITECGWIGHGWGICRNNNPTWKVNQITLYDIETCSTYQTAQCVVNVVGDQVCSYYLPADTGAFVGVIIAGVSFLAVIITSIVICILMHKRKGYTKIENDEELL